MSVQVRQEDVATGKLQKQIFLSKNILVESSRGTTKNVINSKPSNPEMVKTKD